MTTLLVCGSRLATPAMLDYTRRAVLRARDLGWNLICGDAAGVDNCVLRTCCQYDIPFEYYGPTAHPRQMCCARHIAFYHQAGTDYLTRDRYMVERCDRCLAVCHNHSRGTMYTYSYALKQGKPADIRHWSSE